MATPEERAKKLISDNLDRLHRSVTYQIIQAIFAYEAGVGHMPEKISINQSVYEALKEEQSRYVVAQFTAYVNNGQDYFAGIPVEVIADSPDGYVCVGGDLRAVRYERLDD